jgi:predicted DNA-binding transcriptional regulator AlpA
MRTNRVPVSPSQRQRAQSAQPAPSPAASTRWLSFEDLPSKGITFHRNYLRRLWERGDFPPPTHLSPRKLAWPESAIDAWLAEKLAASTQRATR